MTQMTPLTPWKHLTSSPFLPTPVYLLMNYTSKLEQYVWSCKTCLWKKVHKEHKRGYWCPAWAFCPLNHNGPLSTSSFPIPHIHFSFNPPSSSWTVDHLQFPLCLTYASTFHSCLGLTLNRAVFNLKTEVFAHGQLCTALSRICTQEDGLVLLHDDHCKQENPLARVQEWSLLQRKEGEN